ncbi:pancreatic triacylglycerol lipase-like [Ambystoma mexicanum]|uniref:pancreatic triacylglycerol lipase-like n=1 Tax=Ambystoma mexicanum TaxID=8296 RepID=UPI0037E838E1
MLGTWATSLFLLGVVRGREVCYDRLGCFTDDIPWAGTTERPIAKLPWPPEKVNTRFLLYTRENPNNFQEITAINPATISYSNFNASRKTRFITHGYIDQGEENWLSDMCKRMFQVEDVNCFCVDWSSGSRTLFSQSAANIRVVGAEMAYFIDTLKKEYGYSPSSVHIIGHSLGAHAAGETGRRVKGIARITALDPCEPYFQGTPTDVRLDIADAAFVDVIHTDSLPLVPYLGLGSSHAIGHLDFYPNGGEQMPGCKKNVISQIVDLDGIWEGTRDFVACNHLRSYKYYSESIINKDGFIGYPSPSYDSFKSGTGFPCPAIGCPRMGHYADTYAGVSKISQRFYLNTGDAKDFSRYRYKVSVTLTGSSSVSGYFNVALYGSNGNTRQYEVFKGKMKAGSTYSAFVDAELDVGNVTMIKFIWKNSILNPLFPKLGGQKAVLQNGKNSETFTFCGSETVRENILQTLTPC